MTIKDAKERIDHLKKLINKYRYSRLVLNKELISPEAEDALKKELFDIEQQFPQLITPDSPTQRVAGKPLAEFKKVRHDVPMLSFNDAFSQEDIRDWFTRLETYLGHKVKQDFYVELKIDGLAIELEYEDGLFVHGSTRGDGQIGEDVTQNLRTIEAIPLKLDPPDDVELPGRLVVRGEIIVFKKEFDRINREQEEKGGKLFANPRNIAAGSIRQLNPKVASSRKMDSFEYAVITDVGQSRHEEEHEFLKKVGFKTNPNNKLVHSLEEVFELQEYWNKHRDQLPYEIDGLVVIVNDNKIFGDGGVIGKSPRGAIAYKFSPREATTIVEDIKVQVGRTGALTPVAVMRPIKVGGVTITHATLHNYDEIQRLGLKIGDTVIVSRAGDVIPQVTKVLKELRTGREKSFKIPSSCPIDGSKIIKEGAIYKCSNSQCGARLRESLRHFVSRAALDIQGLGPKIIDRLLDEGLIADSADFFTIKEGDIAALERFGDKSAENLLNEINSKKRVSLPRFIYALGILHVGEETARSLAVFISKKVAVKDPEDLSKIFSTISIEEFQDIPDIGPKVSSSIVDWFKVKKNTALLSELSKVGIVLVPEAATKGNRLAGTTFVLTGTLESLTREQAKDRVRSLGGNTAESVSKNTDYVVAGAEPGSKIIRARSLGVKIIDENEFLSIIK
jgi:DNA ligase (NAD+)